MPQSEISNLKGYLDFSFDLAAHLDKFYQWADYQTKNTFLSSIFPDKVVYDGEGKYRAPNANRVIALFCGLDPNFEVAQMQKGTFYSAFLEMGTPRVQGSNLLWADFGDWVGFLKMK